MTDEQQQHDNVYGENRPASEDRGEHTRDIRSEIAEKDPNKGDVASEMDDARERNADPTGGMGRAGTPKDGTSQGGWQRPEEPLSKQESSQ